ncbi:chemotaxis protein CheX [Oceanotoga sp. DSM 15011]|jgi:chemotaxis protein CheX|uniref:Chemotaxis protein CheX n=1 Tax=Oceanotoga teriensis TaxID=515440 RepID=A0AA45C7J8_9BACT|nr:MULTISPECIES: chemotaxis protein CheX [Oceanotoga]MDN5342135.1 chemotaxis protein CheX [Oceanotoga sp.]MDO7976237.1 chemotaxis protein CheX [Oceanotoga teriensis]PWJ95434.1 chemotaxis protein CheX [Oceanotoga teriensis]UYP01073.1 chemotaxis protein CheX [Oceanotoga sp. DSM 15011]
MIDVKIINSVLSSLTDTFKSAAQTDINLQSPKLVKTIEKTYEIVTTIGFNGVLEGNVIYTLTSETSLEIVNSMMGGMMKLTEVDDMAISAIGELGNMISGAIAVSLEKVGYSIDITPPSVVEGKEMRVSVEGNILKFAGTLLDGKEIEIFLVVKK